MTKDPKNFDLVGAQTPPVFVAVVAAALAATGLKAVFVDNTDVSRVAQPVSVEQPAVSQAERWAPFWPRHR
ncbi:MAG: hypothetical protein H6868_02230 [Rhodospirillales bacterium]|nr:hypothetical protein [Rhodospirillales bacterium]